MSAFAHFSGRVVQVIEALDLYDAVSDDVLGLDRTFRRDFGLKTEIYAEWWHPEREQCVRHVDLMELDERDILIYHYSGYAEHTVAKVLRQKSVKILHYHNITPPEFFHPGTHLYQHCHDGRRQLISLLDRFDLFTGDSQYNVDELIALGVAKDKTQVVPIVLDTAVTLRRVSQPSPRNVLFVGRIAENKRQDRIIEVYAGLLKSGHQLGKLVLVGRYDAEDPFYGRLTETVRKLGLQNRVEMTGKIGQAELDEQYARTSLFLSMSEHEGFCVPLLEACRRDIPVLALARAATPETLRHSPGLFETDDEVEPLVARIENDPSFLEALLDHQRAILAGYDDEVRNQLVKLLDRLIPQPDSYTSVSIVICTYNRGDLLDRTLDYLQRQHDPRFEVVVVDGPSTDHTAEVIGKWRRRIKFAKNPQCNLSISRNIGIRLAAGDIIAFIDDDALPFDDWVGTLLTEYNSVPCLVGGIGGMTYYAGSLDFQAEDIVIDSYGRGTINPARDETQRSDRYRTLLGTNSSFKRNALLEVGGFDEEYDYFLDESDVCMRILNAGYRLLCSRRLFLRHEFAQSDNRVNKYRYNWYSICKNTTYFAIRFNVKSRDSVISEVRKRIEQERIANLVEGLKRGAIQQGDFDSMCADIWRGVEVGIQHAESERCLLRDAKSPPPYQPYATAARAFMPLHIVLVTKEFPLFTSSGGVGTLFYHLASELLLMGHRVSVIAQGAEDSVCQRGRFALHRVPPTLTRHFGTGCDIAESNLNWSMDVAEKIIEIHRLDPISVIDTCVWDYEMYAFAAYRPRMDIPIAVRLVTPFAVASQSNGWKISERDTKLVMGLERGLVEMADCVIPISRSVEVTFNKIYGLKSDERWHLVPAGVSYWPMFDVSEGYNDISHLTELADAKKSGRFIFLFLGRLERRKGVDVFLSAVQRFVVQHQTRNDYLFVLAGRDCMELGTHIDDHLDRTARERMLLMGELSLVDREKVYDAADVVVFPSRYESFGLVPLEAFVHGKPVIGADVGAIPEVVQHDRSGLLFEDGDPSALAECLTQLLNDRALCQRLGQGANQRIRELSSRMMALRSEELYRRIVLTGTTDVCPSLSDVGSQACTAAQFNETVYDEVCGEIQQKKLFHRKQWEYVYIIQALKRFDLLRRGVRGLGFGCGKEPLAALMAKYGCDVLATDIAPLETGSDPHWGGVSVEELFYPGICSRDVFIRRVSFRSVNMNEIPEDLIDFDFLWSCCALELLGSLEAGLRFVIDTIKCLRPGGIAVHTTELNVSDGDTTLETSGLSLYRKRDLIELQRRLEEIGCSILPFNWFLGDQSQDSYIDLPPYKREPHLKLLIDSHVITSYGFVVIKNRVGSQSQSLLN